MNIIIKLIIAGAFFIFCNAKAFAQDDPDSVEVPTRASWLHVGCRGKADLRETVRKRR